MHQHSITHKEAIAMVLAAAINLAALVYLITWLYK